MEDKEFLEPMESQSDDLEQIKSQSGDKVFRIKKRRTRRRLRIAPDIPGVFRFLIEIINNTPLIPMVIGLAALWLLFSFGLYLAERGLDGQISTYGNALWWSFAAMHTQGANSPGPISALGLTIGSIWSILSTVAFFGIIVGTLYAYYMLPRRSPSREMIATLQYNLEEFENLSAEELELFRDTTVKLVNNQIQKVRELETPGQST